MNMMGLTTSFTEAALRAALDLREDSTTGIPIPDMDGYFIIQEGRKPNGDSIVATIQAEDGKRYDIYASTEAHE